MSFSRPLSDALTSCVFVSGSRICFKNDLFPLIDKLRSSIRNGVWFKDSKRTRVRIVAKIKKGKKQDYPWPDDIDPNVKGGYLSYLSRFKPLTEKPKPVTLAFEKPLIDLKNKIMDVRKMADETGLDFSKQISLLETKYQQALKDLYTHLTPIQRLNIARHPNRPTFLDHVLNITEKWVELHGDRAGHDDRAIVTGIGSIDGQSYMLIGHQKGRNTTENIERNFAMPIPPGYRKAKRMMEYADHHGLPIITFIDTPGAYADLKSEELGQGEAIANNLRTMFGLKVPIITVVIGEGGSGGALAIGCANKLFMLENSVFYVASPEACAAIMWKSSQAAPKAAEKLRITATEHYKRKIADGIIPEPLGGAHADPTWTSQQLKLVIMEAMRELKQMNTEELLRHRMLKFRSIGVFQEGIPVEPEKKRNLKKSDIDTSVVTIGIDSEIENLKKQILAAKGPHDPISDAAIEKLKQDVDKEITKAFISMGLQEKLESLKLELFKSSVNLPDHPLKPGIKEKANMLMKEFKLALDQPGSYLELKQKLEKLTMVNRLVEKKAGGERLKREINQKLRAEVKEKMEVLKKAQEMVARGEPLDKNLSEEVERAKGELKEVLKSANLEVVGLGRRKAATVPPNLEEKMAAVDEEIGKEIKRAINLAGLQGKIAELKEEIGRNSSRESVVELAKEIKEAIVSVVDSAALKEKIENLITATSTEIVDVEGSMRADNGTG